MAEGRPNGRCRQLQLVKDIGDKGETEKEETDAGSGVNQDGEKKGVSPRGGEGGLQNKGKTAKGQLEGKNRKPREGFGSLTRMKARWLVWKR